MWCSLLLDVKYLPREKLLRYYDCFGKFLIPFVSKILCEKMHHTISPMHMLFTIVSFKLKTLQMRKALGTRLWWLARTRVYISTIYHVNMHHKLFKWCQWSTNFQEITPFLNIQNYSTLKHTSRTHTHTFRSGLWVCCKMHSKSCYKTNRTYIKHLPARIDSRE